MILRSTLFKRITIVGVGLMGGSLGLAIKKYRLAQEVIGLSYRQSSLVQAIRIKAIDTALTDAPKAIRNADCVILAAPVESIVKLLTTINPYLKRNCIVTDVGSTKVAIVEEAEKVLSSPSSFVGSHPLAGSEKKGANFARAELFENSVCLMTPTSKTNQVAKEKIKHLWTKIGANVKTLTPEKHDEVLGYISHLPHLVAYGLINVIPSECLDYATPGLKDTTRIASSSAKMWNDICLANSKNILKSLDELVQHLSFLRRAIVKGDQKSLIQHFTTAKEKRDGLNLP